MIYGPRGRPLLRRRSSSRRCGAARPRGPAASRRSPRSTTNKPRPAAHHCARPPYVQIAQFPIRVVTNYRLNFAPPSFPWDSGVRPAPPRRRRLRANTRGDGVRGPARGAGRAVTRTPRRLAATQPSSKQSNYIFILKDQGVGLESRLETKREEQQVVAWKEAGIKIMRKAKLPNVSLDRDEDGGSAG